MNDDYLSLVVIGCKFASYLLFYSSVRCVIVKELFICKIAFYRRYENLSFILFFFPLDNFTVKAV